MKVIKRIKPAGWQMWIWKIRVNRSCFQMQEGTWRGPRIHFSPRLFTHVYCSRFRDVLVFLWSPSWLRLPAGFHVGSVRRWSRWSYATEAQAALRWTRTGTRTWRPDNLQPKYCGFTLKLTSQTCICFYFRMEIQLLLLRPKVYCILSIVEYIVGISV